MISSLPYVLSAHPCFSILACEHTISFLQNDLQNINAQIRNLRFAIYSCSLRKSKAHKEDLEKLIVQHNVTEREIQIIEKLQDLAKQNCIQHLIALNPIQTISNGTHSCSDVPVYEHAISQNQNYLQTTNTWVLHLQRVFNKVRELLETLLAQRNATEREIQSLEKLRDLAKQNCTKPEVQTTVNNTTVYPTEESFLESSKNGTIENTETSTVEIRDETAKKELGLVYIGLVVSGISATVGLTFCALALLPRVNRCFQKKAELPFSNSPDKFDLEKSDSSKLRKISRIANLLFTYIQGKSPGRFN
jgi:hypothetical protein